jgi:YVTN family beta-propeller protein
MIFSISLRLRSRKLLALLCLASALPCPAQTTNQSPGLPDASGFVGRTGSNTFETPVQQRLTPAGTLVELPGLRPQAVALSPDAQLLLTSGHTHELLVLDPVTGHIRQRVPLPPDAAKAGKTGPVSAEILDADPNAQLSYTGLVFSPDGRRIFMANVNGDIKVFEVREDRTVAGLYSLPLPPANAPERVAEIPAGIAVSADGKRLYVALDLSNRLAEMDATTGRVLRMWNIGVDPYTVVLAGHKAYVSNWGGRRPAKDSRAGPAGEGTLVRVDNRYIASEGSVSIIDLSATSSAAAPVEILTGLHASALALSPNGRFIVVANAGSDTLSVIDTRADEIVETISVRQDPGDLFGAQPNALAFDHSGKTLFACNGTQNAIAVVDFAPGRSRLLGLVPVGWFPGAIVHDSKRHTLCVANIKGFGPGRLGTGGRKEFNTHDYCGTLSLVPVPSASELTAFTRTALADMRYPVLTEAKLPARPVRPPAPVPERVGEPSVFQHVVYVIKENRTYDQVLGDVAEGNGEASLCIFGEHVTPNFHKLVRDFALLDNTYCSGVLSADGHQWADTAMVTDYLEKSFAGFPRSYPAGGSTHEEDAVAYSPAGFIWDDALAHGKTLRDYGEFTSGETRWKDRTRRGHPGFLDNYRQFLDGTDDIALWSIPDIESLRPYVATNTPGWNLSIPDVFRAAQFIKELKQFEQSGDFPNLVLLWLPNDHTSGVKPGNPTPAAQVADNDLAFGHIVEALSHSRFWKDTCLFAIEDDPQAGWDHVSAYRTTAFVVSPYTKRHQVVGTQYNQPGILRTIELILGLPPMNQLDATARPMFDCFTNVPDFTPYLAVTNQVPLDQMNPSPKKLSDSQLRKDAYASARLPLDKPDQCPEDSLNRILWRSVQGPQTPYPQWAIKTGGDDD